MAANPNWEALAIQLPGEDLLEGARNVMETLMVYLEVTKAVLETVKTFLVDFGNPIKALVEALLALILDLFEALHRTGVYGWFDVPNPLVDPNFNRFVGGFPAFITRFKAGLYDSRDPNRPQPIPGTAMGGFTIIVADAESPPALLHLIQVLLRFFGKEFTTPRYPAPANFKVLPIKVTPTGAGDPILALTALFQEQPSSIAVEWSLPPASSPGDPGFSDLIQAASTGFIPPKFLLEKSEINPAVGQIDASALGDPEAVGQVVMSVPTNFRERGKGDLIQRTVKLVDFYQDPFLKFQQYIVIDSSQQTATFLLGQLGTFRYIDTDVQPNKTYYYRVRAFSGSLAVSGKSVTFDAPKLDVIDSNPYIDWPGTDSADPPVMGKASPTTAMTIPTYPEQFDVIETLRRIFQTAFSLNFHLPLTQGFQFDSLTGLPISPAENTDIGKSSLEQLAGALTSFEAIPRIGDAVSGFTAVTAQFQPDPATNLLPVPPWDEPLVRHNAARLSNIVASAMLQANSAVSFKGLMESAFPKGVPVVPGLTATNLKELVYEITKVQDPEAAGQAAVQTAGVLYSKCFSDPQVRLNVLAAVDFCKGFTLTGSDINWIQVSVLRDIAPWSGQLIYDMLAKMQALLDAYSGVMTELKAFIDLIVQKIDTLERFLEYLTSILNFIESLSLGFFILSVPETDGDVNTWVSLIDNAGGTKPPSGPGGYTGGVAFAYVAPDITPFKTAFSLLF
jgi:hypothetical protein